MKSKPYRTQRVEVKDLGLGGSGFRGGLGFVAYRACDVTVGFQFCYEESGLISGKRRPGCA